MNRLCLECGALVPRRSKERGGNQPGFCSDECRLRRKRETTRRWIKDHHARKLAVDAVYREAYKAAKPDYFRAHYAANREKRKREANEWYHANAEYALERQKAYVAKVIAEAPEHYLALKRKHANTRRAIKASVFVEVVDARTVFARDKGICGICQLEVDVTSPWEVDHIVPISKGGPHSYANVQLSHQRCNRRKAAKIA